MATEVGFLKGLGQKLDGLKIFQSGGRLAGWLGVGMKPDTFARTTMDYLKSSRTRAPQGFLQRALSLVPKRFHPMLGKGIGLFNTLPAVRSLSHFMKGNVMVEGLFGGFRAVQDGYHSAKEHSGSFLGKLFSGVTNGVLSLGKAVGSMAAMALGAFAIPKVLGISPLGVAGMVTGLVGSMFVSSKARSILDALIPTGAKGKTESASMSRVMPFVPPVMANPNTVLIGPPELSDRERRYNALVEQSQALLEQSFGRAGARQQNPFIGR